MSFQVSIPRGTFNERASHTDKAGVGLEPGLFDGRQPLLAGAHARGMADAFELAGVAAIMIDARGRVLHVGGPARALLGIDLRLEHDRLVASSAESSRAIVCLIAEALAEGDLPNPITLQRIGRAQCKVSACRLPGAAKNPCQILKALIIIEELPQ